MSRVDPNAFTGDLAWFGGNLYVANYGNNTIEKFDALGQGSVFASTNLLNSSFPEGMAFDSSGDLYVANHGPSNILKFNQDGVGKVFASGLGNAVGIAIEEQVPEPSSLLLAALSMFSLGLFAKRRRLTGT